MAALTLVLELRTTGQALGMIGREIALDIAALNHAPDLVSHIPGVANVTADALSRLQHPSGKYRVPLHLEKFSPSPCPMRSRSFYKTMLIEEDFRRRASHSWGSEGVAVPGIDQAEHGQSSHSRA